MKNKYFLIGVVSICLVLGMSFTSLAGQWVQDTNGWWYQEYDGSYPSNTWKEIEGKQYYFGSDGYMLSNTTTPDGYKVGADGSNPQTIITDISGAVIGNDNKLYFSGYLDGTLKRSNEVYKKNQCFTINKVACVYHLPL